MKNSIQVTSFEFDPVNRQYGNISEETIEMIA